MRRLLIPGLVSFLALAFQSNTTIQKTDVPAHPYDLILGRVTADAATVSIVAYSDTEAYLEYGPDPDSLQSASSKIVLAANQASEVRLEGLEADAVYHYRLRMRAAGSEEDFAATPVYRFHTQRPPGAEFTFLMQADSHLDDNTEPELYAQSMRNMAEENADFLVDLGDTFMTDKFASYKDAERQYMAQRYYFGLLCHSAPLFLALGNHDGELGRFLNGGAENMAVWSNAMRKRYYPNPVADDFYSGNTTPDPVAGTLQNYYAFTWGDALFVVLDPFWNSRAPGGNNNANAGWAWTLGETQYRWLKQTLETSPAKYKFLFLHHLVGGGPSQRGGAEVADLFEWGGKNVDGSSGWAENRKGWETPIHNLLVDTGVSAVFHGHDHLYVREQLDGIVYQEVPQPGFPRYDSANSAVEYGYRSGDVFGSPGYLRVTVSPAGAKVDYVRSYLARDTNAQRRNRGVTFTYTIEGR